ncbi:MAG: hypothetical protein KF910_00840 [Brevundimonas sp.]|uniref:hypothetical protein n=1 Tax=Brevundimonas sp. TaxID=1871086 RepID=UPI0025C3CF7C|nr:hypothetical protein [Brevundimonas sp.]MBX3476134.1 hypothetical protein [Brevundimonas sp.]
MRVSAAFLVGILGLAISGCVQTEPPKSLPSVVDGVDEIHVVANVGCTAPTLGTGYLCNSITDGARIERIVAFVNARPNRWIMPWAGAPIHPIRIEFRKDGRHQETFGISASSFERATFFSQHATRAEVDEALDLVGLERSNLRFDPEDQIPE